MLKQIGVNLVANLIQGAVGLLSFPLTTIILGPEDYGVYAIAITISAFVTSCCEFGYSYLIYGRISNLDKLKRSELISSLLIMGILSGIFFSILLYYLWKIIIFISPVLNVISIDELLIICLAVPIRVLWSILNPTFVSIKKSNLISHAIIIQSIATLLITLIMLFIFDQKRASLFYGFIIGIISAVSFLLFKCRDMLSINLKKYWVYEIKKIAPLSWLMSVIENIRPPLENVMMSRFIGLIEVGNFLHAKQYHGIMMQSTNAFNNAALPYILKEAKNKSKLFIRTKLVWGFVYTLLTLIGLIFVFYGERIVGLLTNDKFTLAAKWIPFLFIYLLFQHSGKSATAIMYVNNLGNFLSRVRIVSLILAIVSLIIFIPKFGINAVIIIMIIEIIFLRYLIIYFAKKIQNFAFQDGIILIGSLFIFLFHILLNFVQLSEIDKFLAFSFSILLFLIININYLTFLKKYFLLFLVMNN